MRYITLIRLILTSASIGNIAFAAEASDDSGLDAFLPEKLYPELNAIIASAEINAPVLRTHTFYTEEANERFLQAKARRHLTAQLFANVGPRNEYYQNDDTDDTSSFAMNAGINLYRPIYHWGAIEAGIEQARLGGQAANLEFERKRSDLIRNLRADFLNLHLTEQAYRNEIQKQLVTDEKIKRAELQHQSGQISEVQLRSILLEKEQSLLSLERMTTQKEQITARFKVNYGWKQALNITPSIPQIQADEVRQWLQREKETLNESTVYRLLPIQQQLNALEHHKEQKITIAANNKPLINLFLSGTQGQTNTATSNDVDTFAVIAGINVNWNIFDGFRTKHQKIEANIKERRLEAQLENSVANLLLEQKRILNSLSLRFRELGILEEQFSIQKDQHLQAQQDLESGRITEPQLQASSLALESMQYRLYEARANALMGISDYSEFTRLTASRD